jgi:ATP-dependent Clp protease ATP-binding subunit ClpC
MAALVAGTTLRGEFEARLQRLVKEASEDSNVIIFIDEIHLMMGAGQGSGAMDAANILKPALSRGEIRVIGATTTAEYRRFIEKDPAMERRFQLIKVEEPTREEAMEIMRGLRPRMEKHHHAKISDDALETSVDLSLRYLPEQRLPDKAIDLIDQACSQARLQSLSGDLHALFKEGIPITGAEIISVISHRCGIPIGKLTEAEGTRLLEMECALEERVKGQNTAIAAVSQAVRLSRSGLKNPKKPIGVFLFAGATGSGKTELAKALAGFLYGDERKLLRFDMSEFMDEHSVSKLIGSPPGFRDHEQGGQLTEKIRSHPYSVVLFDEIEKGHPKIMDIFLQIFDEGILTDSRGRCCDFKESIIILTSNLGSGTAKAKLGFGREVEADDSRKAFTDSVISSIKKTLRPELINRLSEIVVFQPLSTEDIRRVINKFLAALGQRLESRKITIKLETTAYDFLMREGYSLEFGARPMERAIETMIAKPLADLLIRGDIQNGSCVIVSSAKSGMAFRVG